MLKAIITIGIPSSGKSSFANELCRNDPSWIKLDKDDLRFSLTGSRGWDDYSHNKNVELVIEHIQREAIKRAASRGLNVIIAEVNLSARTRRRWKLRLEEGGYEVEFREFPIELEEALRRDRARGSAQVGDECVHKFYRHWLHYLEEKDND